MFAITLKLNEKGNKVCGVNTKTILVDSSSKPNAEEINEAIAQEFIPELVEEIVSVGTTFEDVIQSGDIVFFIAQETVDNGQIAAVFIDEEVTLKRVYYYREKNKLILQPENPAYEPLVYVGEELNSIRIIGRAVAHLRRL